MTKPLDTAALPHLPNSTARRLFMSRHGLLQTPKGPGKGADLLEVIEDLGFVQLDSINTVARAHHMILAARRPAYREKFLKALYEKDGHLFEHWTHDASVIPIRFYPHWKLKFARDAEKLKSRWRNWRRDGFEEKFDAVLKRIEAHGPVTSGDVGEDEERKSGGWWDWHPSKTALEYLWRSGQLAVCRRDGFQKVYDLSDRVIPRPQLAALPAPQETISWACREALTRLGFATSGEIAAFFDIVTPLEAKSWCAQELAAGRIIEVLIGCGEGHAPRRSFVFPDVLDEACALEAATSRLRILSPFDPMLRDRKRAERLFDFHYRIEVFVPEPKRKYGYYVFPVLEGERLVGRIDMKAFRAEDRLQVTAFWPERGVRTSKGRLAKLDGELARMARFASVSRVDYADGWLRAPFS
ncbi:crosslink repair DNA glycosylase YcaQ family protein [Labrenzia sp. CE80]|uniref:winged helix-turn-helix domain-containing protein n=1 Tax=Labrenzia sp. CE80 TaxID=1788986 RepID=UPI00129A1AA4|nr:crosslink repair DNA glycosylase YcaQ family protein [Labrenzia sp. CE80]